LGTKGHLEVYFVQTIIIVSLVYQVNHPVFCPKLLISMLLDTEI